MADPWGLFIQYKTKPELKSIQDKSLRLRRQSLTINAHSIQANLMKLCRHKPCLKTFKGEVLFKISPTTLPQIFYTPLLFQSYYQKYHKFRQQFLVELLSKELTRALNTYYYCCCYYMFPGLKQTCRKSKPSGKVWREGR